MATNFELKARIPSSAHGHTCAQRLGAAFQGVLIQRDTYFRLPTGRLKLRECEGRDPELIYYERDESTFERWSSYRKEAVDNPGGLTALLADALGILVIVEKRRHLYLHRNARIHIDEVEGLGPFIEFEVMGEESADSRAVMRELRLAFGIEDGDVIRGSYSDMISAKRNAVES